MTSSTSDAGRALFGISRAGMTIKQFGVLIGSLVLFVWRRVVQDKEGVHMREDVPQMPDAEEQAALMGTAPAAAAVVA